MSEIPIENLEKYDALVAMFPDIQRKGKKVPYTSLNGNMFSYLGPDGTLALRLNQADREKFIDAYNTSLDVQHGSVMKEYVRVPLEIQLDLDKCSFYFQRSLDYAKTLKPK